MIVAYNALSLRPGVFDGGATYTLSLLAHLPAALPEARFIVFVRDGEDRIEPSERVEVRCVRGARTAVRRVLVETLTLGSQLRRANVSVAIVPNESLPVRLQCPVVVVAQNLVYHRDDRHPFRGATLRDRLLSRTQASYYRIRMARAYARADAVIAVSNETARVLTATAGLDLEKTVVIHEGSDSVLLPEKVEPVDRAERVLVVSTLAPYKNLERTLEIFALLRADRPQLKLRIVGSDWRGYQRVIERKAEALDLAGSFELSAETTREELVGLYAGSKILLLLSECEAFGLPVLEAMRYGLPVVVADRSSLPEVAGSAALVVDPDDVGEASVAVASLLSSPQRLAEFAELGRIRSGELTWDRTAEGVAATLRAVMVSSGTRR